MPKATSAYTVQIAHGKQTSIEKKTKVGNSVMLEFNAILPITEALCVCQHCSAEVLIIFIAKQLNIALISSFYIPKYQCMS